MDTGRIIVLKNTFDGIVHKVPEENVEYWLARELMPLLGYTRWENFVEAIRRAESACSAQGIEVSHHFRGVTKMISLPRGESLFFNAETQRRRGIPRARRAAHAVARGVRRDVLGK